MIEKIQFGGITRRPSDLSSKEGACEESLNVTLDVNEIAPVIEPEDRTVELVGNTLAVAGNTSDRYIYIHKTGSYENFIALNESAAQIWAYINGVRSGDSGSFVTPLVNLSTGNEMFKDITSIGNTLIVNTDKNLHYVLYKDGAYTYLGTKIPEPMVDFRAVPTANGVKTVTKTNAEIGPFFTNGVAFILGIIASQPDPAQVWDDIALNYDSPGTDENDLNAKGVIDGMSAYLWDQYYRMRNENQNNKVFSNPVFLRSAIRLYDESYIYQSVPYLMHAGEDWTYGASMVPSTTGGDLNGLSFRLGHVYEAKVNITYPDLSDWKDIVRSVDIFASTDINYPKVNVRIDGAVQISQTRIDFRFLNQPELMTFTDEFKNEILSKVNFYLLSSTEVEKIGGGISFVLEPVLQDELLVKSTLPDDNLSHHTTRPHDGMTAYNSRLVYRGLDTTLYSGHPFLQSMKFETSRTGVFTNDVMEFRYFIRTEDGDTFTVIGKSSAGLQQFTYPTETVGSNPGTTYYGLPCGFIYYPDPRCYKVEIYYGSVGSMAAAYSIPMKEHPGLNGSYAICSLEDPITYGVLADGSLDSYPSAERKSFSEDNKLAMSEAMNPFAMLLTNRMTFTDAILSVATTTKALSTGQFGQFPLYVFTKGGIWAVPITDTGSLAGAVPLSRDVALSSESVTPIDQAIVFVTKRGVMLLTGSEVRELSPEMDGRHYSIEEDAADLLADTEWEKYLGILADNTPFMTFMKDARTAYDYAGRRLVFFNGQTAVMQTYQYVYRLDTQTWHKMSLLQTGFGFTNILNGYPDALICFRNSGGVYRVCDLSVHYDATKTQNALSQVVITRPYNFNLDFISKTIRRMYVRGIFEKENIKTILLGSPDGINYHVIHSLRGPSNNVFFRAIILGVLAPEERVSYLEVDYESRFKDRIR